MDETRTLTNFHQGGKQGENKSLATANQAAMKDNAAAQTS